MHFHQVVKDAIDKSVSHSGIQLVLLLLNVTTTMFCFPFHRGQSGNATFTSEYIIPRGTTQSAGINHRNLSLTYSWRQVS